MMLRKFFLVLIFPISFFILMIGAQLGSVQAQSEDAPTPISSQAPWTEVNGTISTADDLAEFSFSGTPGQIASLDVLTAGGTALQGSVRLYAQSTGVTVNDAIYNNAIGNFSPTDPAGVTAALPITDTFIIEIDPDDAGPGSSGDYTLRFNLLDPARLIEVDDDLAQCPSAPTGFIRSAVRGVSAGGQVSVCEGQYVETLRPIIAESGVFLVGAGRDTTEMIGHDDSYAIEVRSPDAYIADIALTNIDGNTVLEGRDDSSNLTVTNCRITGTMILGIVVAENGPHHDVTVRGCDFKMGPQGATQGTVIRVVGDRALIENNQINTDPDSYVWNGISVTGAEAEIRNNTLGAAVDTTGTMWAINVTGHDPLVEGNLIAAYGFGISVNGFESGSGQGDSPTATVQNNRLFGTNTRNNGGVAYGINVHNVIQAEVRDNSILDGPSLSNGIRFFSSGGHAVNNRIEINNRLAMQLDILGENDPYPVSFNNNTTIHNQAYPGQSGLDIRADLVVTVPITATNNIHLAPDSDFSTFCGIRADRPLALNDHNLMDGFGTTYCDSATPGPNDILADPIFNDNEMHLAPLSPAIDAGTAIGAPDMDFEGDPRPANAGYDIGADELPLPTDLTIAQSGPICGVVSGPYDYEIFINNLGPGAATGVTLSDQLGTGLSLVSTSQSQGSCTISGSLVSCDLGLIPPRDGVTVTISVNPSVSGIITNTVSVSGNEPDPNSNNNQDVPQINVAALPVTGVDLQPTFLEVTQAVQNLHNDAELIAGKQTLVRLYSQSDSAEVENVAAVLHGSRDGSPLPGSPLQPIGAACSQVQTSGSNRSDLDTTINFMLPDEWTEGDVLLTADLNPGIAIPETNIDNNILEENISFEDVPPICIRTFRIRTAGGRDDGGLTFNLAPEVNYLLEDPDDIVSRALRLLPTDQIQVFPHSQLLQEWEGLSLGPYEFNENDKDEFKVQAKLWWWWLRSSHPSACKDAGAKTHYLGMVHENTSGSDGIFFGIGLRPGPALTVRMLRDNSGAFDDPPGGTTLAHELGHNYGRGHILNDPSCGGTPGMIDNNYPYDPCTLDDGDLADPATYFGTDLGITNTIQIITPTIAGDLMSYADSRWISDYNWRAIGASICLRNFDPCFLGPNASSELTDDDLRQNPEILNPSLLLDEELLVVSGIILSDTYQLDNIELLPTGVITGEVLSDLIPDVSTSPHELQLLDGEDNILVTQPFTVTGLEDSSQHAEFFGLAVPFITATEKIQITLQGVEVATRTVSANAPTITVLSPNGGEVVTDTLTVTWQASDQDDDSLTYWVQYSADQGLTWQVIASDVPTTSISVDASLLPGSLSESLVRVFANDGVLTANDVSDAPFTVPDRTPLAAINLPKEGSVFYTGESITLRGQGYDPEGGILGPESLAWSIAGLGVVGTGHELHYLGLGVGFYDITLTASDSADQAGSMTITIEIRSQGPLPPPPVPDVLLYLPTIVH